MTTEWSAGAGKHLPCRAALRACDLCGRTGADFLLEKNAAVYRRCECGFIFVDCTEEDWDAWNRDTFEASLEEYARKSYESAKQRRYAGKLASLERFVPRERLAKSARLLEIGANVGGFLHAAAGRGWSVTGVEPVADCAQYARETHGLDVRATTLKEADLELESFDAIYSNAVFEHLFSPTRTLAAAAGLLRPGGTLFIDAVNYASYTYRRIGAEWKLVDPRMHACLYTPETLRRLCERAGLEVLRLTSHRVRLRLNHAPITPQD